MIRKADHHRRRFAAALALAALLSGTASAQTSTPAPAAALEEDAYVLNPFVVNVDRDRGYSAEQSRTAMGFATEITKTPFNIKVLTEDFLRDLDIQDMGAIAPYVSNLTSSPSNNVGDGANFRLRGVQTLWNTRNGVRRYNIQGSENIARFEVIKGPIAVFFGQQRPGGIINIVTKRPSFKESMQVSTRIDNFGDNYAAFEAQGPLGKDNKWLAYRVRASVREQHDGAKEYEFRNQKYAYLGFLVQPVKKVQLYLEADRQQSAFNFGGSVPYGYRRFHGYRDASGNPVAGQEGEYSNPPQALRDWAIATQAQPPNSITSIGWKPSGTVSGVVGGGDLVYLRPGGPSGAPGSGPTTFTVNSSNVVQVLQERWRNFGQNGWRQDVKAAIAAGYSLAPIPTVTAANGTVRDIAQLVDPLPDFSPAGYRYNGGGKYTNYNQTLQAATADLNVEATDWLNFRGLYTRDYTERANSVGYADQPLGDGSMFPSNNPSQNINDTSIWRVEALFQLFKKGHRDDWYNAQNLIVGREVFTDYFRQRGAGPTMNGNFTTFGRNYAGAESGTTGTLATAPGLSGGIAAPTLGSQTDKGFNPFRDTTWNINSYYRSGIYNVATEFARQRTIRKGSYASYQGNFFKNRLNLLAGIRREEYEQRTANSPTLDNYATFNASLGPVNIPTYGANFEIVPGIVAFASYSKSYEPTFNGNRVIVSNSSYNSFLTDAERTEPRPPTKGDGIELGVKASTKDGKISGAISYFKIHMDQAYATDTTATNADPRNADGTTRVIIRTIGGEATFEGYDADLVLNLFPGYSATISASLLPTAKITSLPTTIISAVDQTRLGLRVENAPKQKFSTWHRYSFRSDSLKGLSLGLGFNWQAETQRSSILEETPSKTPAFWTANAMVSYDTKIYNRPTRLALNVSNLTDKEYFYVWAAAGAPRNISLSASMNF